MGALRREMVTHDHPTAVLGGETASLLDAPRAIPEGDPFSRAFETGRGGGGYTAIEERTGGGPEGERRCCSGEACTQQMYLRWLLRQVPNNLVASLSLATLVLVLPEVARLVCLGVPGGVHPRSGTASSIHTSSTFSQIGLEQDVGCCYVQLRTSVPVMG